MKNHLLYRCFHTIILSFFCTLTIRAENVLTLEKCFEFAQENNFQIQNSKGTLESSKGSYDITRSTLLPQVSIQSRIDLQRSSESLRDGPIYSSESSTPYSAYIQVQQQIFDFGKTYQRVNSSKNQLSATERDFETVKESTLLSTYIYFIRVLQAQNILRINQDAQKQTRDHLEKATILFEAGRGIRYNVIKAELDLLYFSTK